MYVFFLDKKILTTTTSQINSLFLVQLVFNYLISNKISKLINL